MFKNDTKEADVNIEGLLKAVDDLIEIFDRDDVSNDEAVAIATDWANALNEDLRNQAVNEWPKLTDWANDLTR